METGEKQRMTPMYRSFSCLGRNNPMNVRAGYLASSLWLGSRTPPVLLLAPRTLTQELAIFQQSAQKRLKFNTIPERSGNI